MQNTSLVQARVDSSLKQNAEMLFADLGLDIPTAIRLFLTQCVRREGLPFEVAKPQPNAETLAAMLNGMERVPKRYKNFREIIAEIEAEESDGTEI